ncbi:hypothetical protein BKA60DRAFT_613780 [Fusarium oxysporum]|nr:hypothetical protein BKA60DRAFT_613780 [Fusarium oxysporum]
MSIYGRATFSAIGYAAARPTYPASLFKIILGYYYYHDPYGMLLDLGSGYGIVTRELSPCFARAIAINPSAIWPELSRGYKDNIIIRYLQANKIFKRFYYDEGDILPGLEGLNYRNTTKVADPETAWIRSKINLRQFKAYMQAFTAYQGWIDMHPDKKSRAEGGKGDIMDILFN